MNENERNFKDLAKGWSKIIKEEKQKQDKESQEYFESLSYEEQLKAFYHVCRIIWLGEIIERRTYRGVLYEMFKFGPDAYSLGMDCGFFDIHNNLFTAHEIDESIKKILAYLDVEIDRDKLMKCRQILLYGGIDKT